MIVVALVALSACTHRSGLDFGSEQRTPLRAAGAIAVANVRATSVDLSWPPAASDVVPQDQLVYQVYFTTSLAFGNVDEILAGTRFGASGAGLAALTVTGLAPATSYRFGVVATDGQGNAAAYAAVSVTTTALTPPVTGAVLVSSVSRHQVDLMWPAATDDLTPRSQLVYQVYYSTSAAFDTESEVRAGTAVGPPAVDVTSVTVTGLAGATTYYFNVVVSDTSGLSSVYAAGSAETSVMPIVTIGAPADGSYVNAATAAAFALTGACSEAGRSVTISGAATGAVACAGGSWSATLDLSALADGAVGLFADHSDAAGAAAAQASRSFVKDTIAPTVAITSPAAGSFVNAANVGMFVVSGTCSEDGRSVSVSGAATGSAICSSGTWSATLNLSAAANGPVIVYVDLTDAAGNAATQASRSFTKNTTAPTVAITSPAAGSYVNAANVGSFAVSGTCSENGRSVSLSGAATGSAMCTAGTWSTTLTLSAAADGTVTIYADHADAAGNAAAQASRSFVKDTIAPTVAITSPAAGSYVNAANAGSFAVSGTCSENGRSVSLSGAATGSAICNSGTWSATLNLSAAANGTVTIYADLSDAAGNAATQVSRGFSKDTTAPTVAITAPAAGGYVSAANVGSFAVSGTCSESGRSVSLSGAATGSAMCNSGTWSATLNLSAAADGTVTLYADHSDGAGNAATQASRSFTKDATAPTVAFSTPAAGAHITTSNRFAFTVTGSCSESGRTVSVSGAATASPTCSGGAWSVALDLSGTPYGTVTVYADHNDAAGNTALQASRSFTHDTPPSVTITSPSSGSFVGPATMASLTVAGTCSVNGRPVSVSGAATATATCSSGTWSTTVDVSGAAEGTLTLHADLSDGAGNDAPQASVSFIKDVTAPAPGGALAFTSVTTASLTVSWPAASDTYAPQAGLQYKLVRAPAGTLIDTVANAEANGAVVVDWTTALLSQPDSGLTIDTTYEYNVLVRDVAGNKAAYAAVAQKTLANLSSYVAFYPFSGTPNDGSGNGNDLSPTGGVALTSNRNFQANRAYAFDGTTGGLTRMNPSGYTITTQVSVSAWVYRTASGDQKVVGNFNDIGTQGWVLGVDPTDSLQADVTNGTEYKLAAGYVPANTWTHLALTWRAGGTLKGYINGVRVLESGTTTTAAINLLATGASFFKVGVEPWNLDSLFFHGSIDDIRVYAQELGPTDIAALRDLPAD